MCQHKDSYLFNTLSFLSYSLRYMSCCTSDLMSWGTSSQISSRPVNFLFTSCSQNTLVHKNMSSDYVLSLIGWVLRTYSMFTPHCIEFKWFVVSGTIFFLGKHFIICKKNPICMYKCYYVLHLCLLFASFLVALSLIFTFWIMR